MHHHWYNSLMALFNSLRLVAMMSDRGNIRVPPLAPQRSSHDPPVSHNRPATAFIRQRILDALSVVYQPSGIASSLPVALIHSAQRTNGLRGYDSSRMAGLFDLLSYDTCAIGAVAHQCNRRVGLLG